MRSWRKKEILKDIRATPLETRLSGGIAHDILKFVEYLIEWVLDIGKLFTSLDAQIACLQFRRNIREHVRLQVLAHKPAFAFASRSTMRCHFWLAKGKSKVASRYFLESCSWAMINCMASTPRCVSQRTPSFASLMPVSVGVGFMALSRTGAFSP